MFVNKITKLGYFKCDKDDKKDGNIMFCIIFHMKFKKGNPLFLISMKQSQFLSFFYYFQFGRMEKKDLLILY